MSKPLTDERIRPYMAVRVLATGEGGKVTYIDELWTEEDREERGKYAVKVWLDPCGSEWEERWYHAEELADPWEE